MDSKAERVANYHMANMKSLVKILAGAGLEAANDITPHHMNKRLNETEVKTYAEIYETLEAGVLIADKTRPANWASHWARADAGAW